METRLYSRTREVVIGRDRSLVMIGERINPTGRHVLTDQLRRGVMDRVQADATAQVDAGAHVLDVNAFVPGADEASLLATVIDAVMEVTDVPLCIDSSNIDALAAGLSAYEGKALVNSVNAEEQRMQRIFPLVRDHQAAVIAMPYEENRVAMNAPERLDLAYRILQRAAEYGIPQHDVIIDALLTPVASEATSVFITLETMRRIRDELGNNTVCGLSNISFGLADRPKHNAAFLPLAINAGLTCVIANPLDSQVRRVLASNA